MSKPFFYSLSQWIYHGDLHDPFSEFFVFPNPSLAHASYVTTSSTLLGAEDLGFGREGERGEGVKSWELWKKKWEFKEDMRPTFVSKEFARKVSLPPPSIFLQLSHLDLTRASLLGFEQIFSTGKSLNFIRYSCQDSDWIVTRAKLENAGKGTSLPPRVALPATRVKL